MKKAALMVMAALLLAGLPGCSTTPYWVKGVDKHLANAAAHNNRGLELLDAKQYAEAEKEFDMALDENEKGSDSLIIGYEYVNPTDYSELDEWGFRFRQKGCTYILHRGNARYYQGNTSGALADWEWVVAQGQKDADYACYVDAGKAQENIETAKSRMPQKYEWKIFK